MSTPASGEFAHIGKSVSIKGELSGSEDVYVDGQVEGNIQLSGNSLTIGPNGRVHANVAVKSVTVGGSLEGNIQASERTELRKTAVVNGDVQTRRIAIEEGAYFKGKLEILAESKSVAAGNPAGAAAPIPAKSTTSPSEQGK
jgi:cytoskeletal protein CcmA (bactofilin family)